MSTQILIRIDEDTKRKIQKIARSEQKSLSQKIREIIGSYVEEHDIEKSISSLWKEIGNSLKDSGYSAKDVERMVREVRSRK